MSVFLTPDAKPFFGGTYFPARDGDRGAATGFLTLVNNIDNIWIVFDKSSNAVSARPLWLEFSTNFHSMPNYVAYFKLVFKVLVPHFVKYSLRRALYFSWLTNAWSSTTFFTPFNQDKYESLLTSLALRSETFQAASCGNLGTNPRMSWIGAQPNAFEGVVFNFHTMMGMNSTHSSMFVEGLSCTKLRPYCAAMARRCFLISL